MSNTPEPDQRIKDWTQTWSDLLHMEFASLAFWWLSKKWKRIVCDRIGKWIAEDMIMYADMRAEAITKELETAKQTIDRQNRLFAEVVDILDFYADPETYEPEVYPGIPGETATEYDSAPIDRDNRGDAAREFVKKVTERNVA